MINLITLFNSRPVQIVAQLDRFKSWLLTQEIMRLLVVKTADANELEIVWGENEFNVPVLSVMRDEVLALLVQPKKNGYWMSIPIGTIAASKSNQKEVDQLTQLLLDEFNGEAKLGVVTLSHIHDKTKCLVYSVPIPRYACWSKSHFACLLDAIRVEVLTDFSQTLQEVTRQFGDEQAVLKEFFADGEDEDSDPDEDKGEDKKKPK